MNENLRIQRAGRAKMSTRSWWLALVVGWWIAVINAPPDCWTADLPDDELRAALELYRAGKLDEAEKILRNLIAEQPDLAEAQNQFGAVLLALGRAAEAVGPLQRACELAPEAFSPRFNLGAARLLTRNFTDARSAFEAALKIKPRDLETEARLAQALLALEQYGQALPLLEDLRARIPDEPQIVFYLGVCLAETGELDRAGAIVDELRSQGIEASLISGLEARIKRKRGVERGALPPSGDANGAGRSARDRVSGGRSKQQWESSAAKPWELASLDELRERIEREPESGEVRFELGLRLEENRNFIGALRAFRWAAELGLHTPALSLATARILAEQSHWDEAKAMLEAALAEWPSNSGIPGPLAWIYNHTGAFQRTKELLGGKDPSKMPASELLELAVAMAELGETGDAEELLRSALEGDPALSKAHYRLGRLLLQRGEREEGAKELKKYQELLRAEKERDRATMRARLDEYLESGLSLLEQGMYGEARFHLGLAMELDPGNPKARRAWMQAAVRQARELLGQERFGEAVELLGGALAKFPGEAILHANLGAALARLDRHSEAIEELLSATAADPRRADYHWALAAEYIIVGDREKAEEHRRQGGILEAERAAEKGE